MEGNKAKLICIFVLLGLISNTVPREIIESSSDINTIYFRHFSGGSHTDFNIRNAGSLLSQLNLRLPLVVYIHGWTESVDTTSAMTVINAFLEATQSNVIGVDYRQISKRNYFVGVDHVEPVGKAVAGVLNTLVKGGVNPNTIHVVGHSLGGQVAGYVGLYTSFKIPRMTGLDPAGPLFYTGGYISTKSAAFVDIIHTDMGFLGQLEESGTVDFYPNGGTRRQPGCPFLAVHQNDESHCNHHRSWEYYAESVRNPNAFEAVQCKNEMHFKLNECNRSNVVPMGYGVPLTAKGAYYLKTNGKSPYGRGMAGIQ